MPAISDERLAIWGSAPSQTEQEKAERAERAVRNAIAASTTFIGRDVTVFAQGSYRNRTNVRADSDVDICVLCRDTYFYDAPSRTVLPITPLPATYRFDQFRNDVGTALRSFFGADSVRSGSKAFDIHENTYRIAADAVPCFEYHWYGFNPPTIGTAFLSNGTRIVNYPDQHYNNGVTKNTDTGRRFKSIVRIVKHLRYDMLAAGVESAKHVPSYLLESLVWNVPNEYFGAPTLREVLVSVMVYLYGQTKPQNIQPTWFEVNSIKYLFSSAQPWTVAQAHAFLIDAWGYAELS